MKKTVVVVGVAFLAFCLLFAATVQAAFYMGKVITVATRPETGHTIIQVDPGTDENRFVDEGPPNGTRARIRIDASDPGANAALAAVFTAMSMGREIQFEVENPPSWSSVQTTTSVAVTSVTAN